MPSSVKLEVIVEVKLVMLRFLISSFSDTDGMISFMNTMILGSTSTRDGSKTSMGNGSKTLCIKSIMKA